MYAVRIAVFCALMWSASADLLYVLSGVDSQINITAAFIKNATDSTLSAVSVNSNISYPLELGENKTTPCMIIHPRVDACAAMFTYYGGLVPVINQLCETNDLSNCTYAPILSHQCSLINSTTECTNVWCMYQVNPAKQSCYNFVLQFPGYQCGQYGVCTQNLTCVDARVDSCNTTLTLIIPSTTPPDTYNVESSVINHPLITSGGIFAVLNAGSPALEEDQILSPGDTPVVVFTNVSSLLNITIPRVVVGLITPGSEVSVYLKIAGFVDYLVSGGYIYTNIPTVYNLCPGKVIAFVTTNVVVSGFDFYNSSSLQCRFASNLVPVIYVSSTTVVCVITPLNDTLGVVPLLVSNDLGLSPLNTAVSIQVLGACQDVKPGSVVPPGGESCECPPGTLDTGAYCDPCSVGSYQPNYAQSSCIPCGVGTQTTLNKGTILQGGCYCADGYRSISTGSGMVCTRCVQGMVCTNGEFGVAAGYWQAPSSLPETSDEIVVLPCESAGTHSAAARCIGGYAEGDQLCARGYEGPLCMVCSDGYGSIGGACAPCNNPGADGFIVLLLAVLACLALYILVRLTTAAPDPKNRGAGSVIKIFMNYIQIIYYIGTLSAKWAPYTLGFFDIFLPMSMSPSFVSIKCVSHMDFYTRIGITACLPFLVAILLLGVFQGASFARSEFACGLRASIWYWYVLTLLVALYIIHPMIASSILTSFNCTHVPGPGGGNYMTSDMSINCDSTRYRTYVSAVIVYFLIYVVGGPVWVLWRIHKNKDAIIGALSLSGNASGESAYRYVYFTRGYKSSTIVWEGVVLFRKLAVVAIAALIKGGLQLVWVAVILVGCMCLTIERMPYNSRLDNRLEIISLAALCLSLVLAFHSFFLGNDGEVILFFLALVNGSAAAIMVMASFSRFRGKIFLWTMRLTAFFALACILPPPEKQIEMRSRRPPPSGPPVDYIKTRDELDREAAITRGELLTRAQQPKRIASFSSSTMPVDIVDMADTADPWAGEGEEETDV